ncbi:hypothetical protein EJB05_50438, partial [Eragrostis curvula]
MGPAMKKDPLAFFPSSSSPPSKTPPPPPHRRPHLPLPPPPPLHLRSSLPPLPPPPWGTHSLLIPPGQGTPIPPPAAIPASAAIPSLPEASRSTRGGGDHLVVRTGDCDLAGVPPELLPPKKRVVRHHPYAAAWAIQEMAAMASRGGMEEEKDGLPRAGADQAAHPLRPQPPFPLSDGLSHDVLCYNVLSNCLLGLKALFVLLDRWPVPKPLWCHRGGDDLVVRTRDCDLAGVPPKKRVVRHHPYAAAWAIQEMAAMASRGGMEEEKDGLRAELLRLRISRPAQVLTKPLTLSDRSRDMARLVLPERLVRASPLLGMLTDAERRLVLGPGGLPVPAFDRLGRAYRMTLRRDPSARTYLLRGQWTLFVSRHDMSDGDAVQLLAFRPSAWQARLHKHGEGGLGMAMLHCPKSNAHPCCCWTNRERDAADALLLLVATTPSSSSCRLSTAATAGNGFETTTPVSSQLGVR